MSKIPVISTTPVFKRLNVSQSQVDSLIDDTCGLTYRQVFLQAKASKEPDWKTVKNNELIVSLSLARSRLSGNEPMWKGVVQRITDEIERRGLKINR